YTTLFRSRQAIGALPGTDQMVGRSLAGRIGRAGRVGRGLGEQVVDAVQVAVHLVGGNVVEAEGFTTAFRQALPVGAGGFQQLVGTDDVGLDELGRTVDGAIDMGFGGQVHDGVWLELQQRFANPLTIGDVGLQ